MNFRLSKAKTVFLIAAFLSDGALGVSAGNETGASYSPVPSSSPTPTGSSTTNQKASNEPILNSKRVEAGGCLVDAAAIEDLRKRKHEMEIRQKELGAKETELKAREQALDAELKKLEQARDEILKIDKNQRQEGEEKVAKLVETLENMNPKVSAKLLASLSDPLAVTVMAKISTGKLAKVMNLMEPARSTRLTELLTGYSKKGGGRIDKPTEQHEQQSASDAKAELAGRREPSSSSKGSNSDAK